MTPDRTSILDESRLIEASVIGAMIDRTSCNHVTRKIQSGTHRPQEFIFSIPDIGNKKFMLFYTVGHYLTQCQRTIRAVLPIRENRVFTKIICRGKLLYQARVAQSSSRNVSCDLLPSPRLAHAIDSWGRSGTLLASRLPSSLSSCDCQR